MQDVQQKNASDTEITKILDQCNSIKQQIADIPHLVQQTPSNLDSDLSKAVMDLTSGLGVRLGNIESQNKLILEEILNIKKEISSLKDSQKQLEKTQTELKSLLETPTATVQTTSTPVVTTAIMQPSTLPENPNLSVTFPTASIRSSGGITRPELPNPSVEHEIHVLVHQGSVKPDLFPLLSTALRTNILTVGPKKYKLLPKDFNSAAHEVPISVPVLYFLWASTIRDYTIPNVKPLDTKLVVIPVIVIGGTGNQFADLKVQDFKPWSEFHSVPCVLQVCFWPNNNFAYHVPTFSKFCEAVLKVR